MQEPKLHICGNAHMCASHVHTHVLAMRMNGFIGRALAAVKEAKERQQPLLRRVLFEHCGYI